MLVPEPAPHSGAERGKLVARGAQCSVEPFDLIAAF
jgi:hypothetical protein